VLFNLGNLAECLSNLGLHSAVAVLAKVGYSFHRTSFSPPAAANRSRFVPSIASGKEAVISTIVSLILPAFKLI
jgi:hypothetical protein